ncbi:hypothetical protein MQC82_04175 [Pseudomonas viridiflava]|uniref:hypothetical protein n=1 Tax=Pseudomonas syringae group TaxID=136849 RepID=UPI0013CE5C88|nr:hypothetical protein [Pseudomonas viridiflava]MCI3908759.1 hypothetical protein [Pseudomonas viridiflava]MCQ9391115.1 hypothetical protein [Pseudomonas viridiflava]MEE4158246.1 hypothetical protein [Pseudomonas viridiflava]WKW34086.1 hypothetical protein KIH13_10490 [Pseudomonas viridiflava]
MSSTVYSRSNLLILEIRPAETNGFMESRLPDHVRCFFFETGFLTVSTVVSLGLRFASSKGMKRPVTESLARLSAI